MKTHNARLMVVVSVIFLLTACFAYSADRDVVAGKHNFAKSAANAVPSRTLEMIKDFATTIKADPNDVNKDGKVDVNDVVSAKAGYALANKYSDQLPVGVRRTLDQDRDGKVTDADLQVVTDSIAKTIVIGERANVPSFNLVNTPILDIIFKGQDSMMINEDHAQKFDSFVNDGGYKSTYSNLSAPAELELNTPGAAYEESAVTFGDLPNGIEYVDRPDQELYLNDAGMAASDQNAHSGDSADSAAGPGLKIDLNIAAALNEKEMSTLGNFISRLTSAIDYVKKSTSLDSFKIADWSIGDDGTVLFMFEAEAGHTVEVTMNLESGVVLESQEAVKSFDNNGNLVGSSVIVLEYDKSGALTESYSKKAVKIDASGIVREDIVEGVIFEKDGKPAGSFVTTSQFSESGVLTESESKVTVSDSADQQGLGKDMLVKQAMDEKGKVVRTEVYDENGKEIKDLSEKRPEGKSKIENKISATAEMVIKSITEIAEAKKAEEKLLAEKEDARKAEETKKVEEAKKAEENRLSEIAEAKKAEEKLLAEKEDARKAEEAKKIEGARKAEEKRLSEKIETSMAKEEDPLSPKKLESDKPVDKKLAALVVEPVKPTSDIVRRKEIESQIEVKSTDKRFSNEMASSSNKGLLPAVDKRKVKK